MILALGYNSNYTPAAAAAACITEEKSESMKDWDTKYIGLLI